MAEKLKLDVVTPYGLVFSEEVDEIIASGSEGEFGVLPDHVPFLTTLKIGVLTFRKGSETGYIFINSGYAEVGPDRVTLLADSAERSDAIDIERAKEAMKRAEERLKKKQEIDEARATSSLERALMRMQVAGKHQAR